MRRQLNEFEHKPEKKTACYPCGRANCIAFFINMCPLPVFVDQTSESFFQFPTSKNLGPMVCETKTTWEHCAIVTIFGCYNHGLVGCYKPPLDHGAFPKNRVAPGPETSEKPEKKTVSFHEEKPSPVAGEGEQIVEAQVFLFGGGFLEGHVAWLVQQLSLKITILTRYIWILFKVDRLEPRNWEHQQNM